MAFLTIFLIKFFVFFFPQKKEHTPKSIYDCNFSVRALTGDTINISQYKTAHKKIMIVNTASQCGNTYQYEDLEALYERYYDKLVIIGFPCDDFGHQEPSSNESIAEFCIKKYNITFPMAAKVSITNNAKKPDIYKWLTEEKRNGYKDSRVTWNFQKYIIDEKGYLIAIFEPTTRPNSPEVIATLER